MNRQERFGENETENKRERLEKTKTEGERQGEAQIHI